MTPTGSTVLDAIAELLSPLLGALERIGWVQRHLYPPLAGKLAEALAPHADALAAPLAALECLACPDDLAFMRDRLAAVAREAAELIRDFTQAAGSAEDVIGLYRALRRAARVQEALYPLAPALAPVSRWFLEARAPR